MSFSSAKRIVLETPRQFSSGPILDINLTANNCEGEEQDSDRERREAPGEAPQHEADDQEEDHVGFAARLCQTP